jgi:hypothetical protein
MVIMKPKSMIMINEATYDTLTIYDQRKYQWCPDCENYFLKEWTKQCLCKEGKY